MGRFKELGRRAASTSEARASPTCGASQSAVATTLALGGAWSGFTYPDTYGKGKGQGEEVLAPAEAPVKRPKDADLTCVTVEDLQAYLENQTNESDLLSSAPGLASRFHLMSVMFVALATSLR